MLAEAQPYAPATSHKDASQVRNAAVLPEAVDGCRLGEAHLGRYNIPEDVLSADKRKRSLISDFQAARIDPSSQ